MRVKDYTRTTAALMEAALAADPTATGLSTFFTYRFINFEWLDDPGLFAPIRFDCNMPYDQLRATYTAPQRTAS